MLWLGWENLKLESWTIYRISWPVLLVTIDKWNPGFRVSVQMYQFMLPFGVTLHTWKFLTSKLKNLNMWVAYYRKVKFNAWIFFSCWKINTTEFREQNSHFFFYLPKGFPLAVDLGGRNWLSTWNTCLPLKLERSLLKDNNTENWKKKVALVRITRNSTRLSVSSWKCIVLWPSDIEVAQNRCINCDQAK